MAVFRLLASAGLGFVVSPARAQIYAFDKEPVPANRTLHTVQAFYVFSLQDTPEAGSKSFVKFSQLIAEPAPPHDQTAEAALKAYQGLQLTWMPYKSFWGLIDPGHFCSTESDVLDGAAAAKDQLQMIASGDKRSVFSHTVRSAAETQRDIKQYIDESNVYILIFSNCGSFTGATVSGTVIVKNPYGFLPGNEYHKMPFYGWLLLLYVILAVAWMGLSLKWWRELFMIQNCIAAVILFGLFESFLWFIFYHDWNSSGYRGKFLFVCSILFTVVKSTFSYMLVLVASLGWGVTRPYLDTKVLTKIQLLSFTYIVLDFIREAVLSFRHSHSLSLAFVLLCLLPVSLLNGVIFSWVFTALSNLMETLKERRQNAKLQLFQKLWWILMCTLTTAVFSLLFQIYNLSLNIGARWKHQWLLTDAVPHGLFIFVLIAMMILWAPNKNSQSYAYSAQIGDGEDDVKEEHPGAIWADDDDVEVEGDDSFWASTKAAGEGKNITVIGASKGDEV